MYDFYGIYASCRDAAWRCQIDFELSRLPVKVLSITRRAGIAVIKNSAVGELRKNEYGATIRYRGNWFIVYDDNLPPEEARMTIAHELGHIFLGHEYRFADHRFSESPKKLRCEREADMFAVRLLAPACVLHELDITDAEGIAELCDIPKSTAILRAKRMSELEERSKFYKSDLERCVRDRFSDFINDTKNEKDSNKLNKLLPPC